MVREVAGEDGAPGSGEGGARVAGKGGALGSGEGGAPGGKEGKVRERRGAVLPILPASIQSVLNTRQYTTKKCGTVHTTNLSRRCAVIPIRPKK